MNQSNWKNFISTGLVDDSAIPDFVSNSWQLCRRKQVDPFQIKPGKILTANELRERKKTNKDLIDNVTRDISQLSTALNLDQPVLILTDSYGNIIWRSGNYQALSEANDIYFSEGSAWDEMNAGTNAIALAMSEKQAITVSRYEHYVVASQSWSCVAAPILDENNEVVGVLDVSTYNNESALNCQLFIGLIAQKISNDIIKDHIRAQQELLQSAVNNLDNRILCDMNGRMVCIPEQVQHKYDLRIGDFITDALEKHRLTCTKTPISTQQSQVGYAYLIEKSEAFHEDFYYPGAPSENKQYNQFLKRVVQVADSNLPIHIHGESGSGKEIIAETIHYNSGYRNGPLVAVNCSAVSENLLESELFGYAPGAFTGAKSTGNKGKIELANHGTLFLDEVDSMTPKMQAALLRVIEHKVVTPIGSDKPRLVDFRLVTATNQDLKEAVQKEKFRADLFYRLYVCPLEIPPLRDRIEDIVPLISRFCMRRNWYINWQDKIFKVAKDFEWKGNIREFNNFLERVYVFYRHNEPTTAELERTLVVGTLKENSPLTTDVWDDDGHRDFNNSKSTIGRSQRPASYPKYNGDYSGNHRNDSNSNYRNDSVSNHGVPVGREAEVLEDHDEMRSVADITSLDPSTVEREHIIRALEQHKYHMTHTAEALGISRSTLYRKLKKYELDQK